MSEALILYRGRGGVDPELLKPTTITSNGNYVAPVTGNYIVYTVGGGGGGGGGCRNSWNSSQVFYGAGGSRGALNTKTVFLNAGDQVPVTLGVGGSGGANNTTVVSNNSRGTNGGSGGTTSFGSYASAAGGSYGQWSWHYHWWSNTYTWNNSAIQIRAGTSIEIKAPAYVSEYYKSASGSYRGDTDWYFISFYPVYQSISYWENRTDKYIDKDLLISTRNLYLSTNTGLGANSDIRYNLFFFATQYEALQWHNNAQRINQYTGYVGITTYDIVTGGSGNGLPSFSSDRTYTIGGNVKVWTNRIYNTNTHCYTSIQSGTWWYQNNNTVSTSGTRTYRGDGGASGQAGNAGFILVIPPQS